MRRRMQNIFFGVVLSFGAILIIWIFIELFFGSPPINLNNIFFLFFLLMLIWLFSGIFSLKSNPTAQGICHGFLSYLSFIFLDHVFYKTVFFSWHFILTTLLFISLYIMGYTIVSSLVSQWEIDFNKLYSFIPKKRRRA